MKGFTLVELLITIVILAILAGVSIIALNPGQNPDDANDVRRRADVTTILNAVWQYAIANNGDFPENLSTTDTELANTGTDICADLVPAYIRVLPVDPSTGSYTDCTTYATGYTIRREETENRITITATLSDSSTYSQTR